MVRSIKDFLTRSRHESGFGRGRGAIRLKREVSLMRLIEAQGLNLTSQGKDLMRGARVP
jgi:hypothetical protein